MFISSGSYPAEDKQKCESEVEKMKVLKKNKTLPKRSEEKKQEQKIKIKQFVLSAFLCAMIVLPYLVTGYADDSWEKTIQSLIDFVILGIGAGIAIRGVFFLLPGIGDYLGAEDDDAQQKKKGRDQIVSGIRVLIVGGVILALGPTHAVSNMVKTFADQIKLGS